MTSKTSTRGARAASALLLASALALGSSAGGCASYQLRGPSDDNDGIGYRTMTLYGTWWQPPAIPEECFDGINDVYVEDNIVFDVVGVATLGIWKPIGVRYRCRAPADIEEPADPGPEYTSASSCAFLWGFWYDPQIMAANEAVNGFHDVRIADNLGYDLVSVVTFGLWKPMTVEYRARRDTLAP